MKVLIRFFVLAGLALSPLSASSELLTMSLKGVSMKKDYTETAGGSTLDTESSKFGGKIGGLEIAAAVKIANGALGGDKSEIGVVYQKLSGKSDYKGSILGSGLGYGSYMSQSSNKIREIELNWIESRRVPYGKTSFIFGIGDRLWERELTSSQKEDYKWKYGHVGLGLDFSIGKSAALGFYARYQRAVSPKMESKGGALSSTFDLGTTDGFRLEAPLSIAVTKNIDLVASYRYDYWKIKASNVINGFYEPDSKTKNQLLTAGISIKW